MVDCREVELTISAYADKEAPEADQVKMFEHLASCAICREFFEVVVAMKANAAREERFRAPAGLSRRVLLFPVSKSAQGAIRRSVHRVASSKVRIPVPLLACMVLLLLLGTFFLSQRQAPQQPVHTSNVILSKDGMSLRVIRVHQQ
jgi:predicted anti-sigma-YlaC factor YlaD